MNTSELNNNLYPLKSISEDIITISFMDFKNVVEKYHGTNLYRNYYTQGKNPDTFTKIINLNRKIHKNFCVSGRQFCSIDCVRHSFASVEPRVFRPDRRRDERGECYNVLKYVRICTYSPNSFS